MIDQDLDPKISRTRLRPMARRAISNSSALIFVVVQIMIRLALVLALLPRPCFFYSIPSILLTGLYSYAKRFTHYPLSVLGCVFSWGVVMALPALYLDVWSSSQAITAAARGFSSCIAWTILYDTMYTAQDSKDDIRAGIKSPVVRHQG